MIYIQITSLRTRNGHVLTIDETKKIVASLIAFLDELGFYTIAKTYTKKRTSTISLREFKLTDKAIRERGGMNLSPWKKNIRRRHVGFEDWIILTEAMNKFFDAKNIETDIDARIGNRTTRIRSVVYGAKPTHEIREEFVDKKTRYYDKKKKMYTHETTFEELWKPENFKRTKTWWNEKRKKIEELVLQYVPSN